MSGNKGNREVEVKLRYTGYYDLRTVFHRLEKLFPEYTRMVYGRSKDTYWTLDEATDSFSRVRERDDGSATLTVKTKDRDSEGLDRLEIDIDVMATLGKVKKYQKAVHGKSSGTVDKEYYVLWLPLGDHTTVSAYQVGSDIYIELETPEMCDLEVLEVQIREYFEVEKAGGSLHYLYVLGGKK